MTERPLYYDLDGQPITQEEWASMFEYEQRRIGAIVLPWWLTGQGGARVSTVWLGLDHRWGGDGPPLIFETMIFYGNSKTVDGWEDEYQRRYSTKEAAIAGHRRAVKVALFPTVMKWLGYR